MKGERMKLAARSAMLALGIVGLLATGLPAHAEDLPSDPPPTASSAGLAASDGGRCNRDRGRWRPRVRPGRRGSKSRPSPSPPSAQGRVLWGLSTAIPPWLGTPGGTSYAISAEIAFLWYRGTAKAAANIYSGKRIVQVCFWWTRAGHSVSGTTCANAAISGGTWQPGPEAAAVTTDSLGWSDSQTIFNIQTTRIDPGVTP